MSTSDLGGSQSLVRGFCLIQEALQPISKVIYYPCCGVDRTPSIAWPDSQVIYADREQHCIDQLRQNESLTHCVDVELFDPGPIDILIMLNPTIDPDRPCDNVKPGGLVICNNYHLTATRVRSIPRFELIGLAYELSGGMIFDLNQPELHFYEVETEEELLRVSPNFHAYVTRIVEAKTGTRVNLIPAYREVARQAEREAWTPTGFYIGATVKVGDQLLPITPLPCKKGTADSLVVFRRS